MADDEKTLLLDMRIYNCTSCWSLLLSKRVLNLCFIDGVLTFQCTNVFELQIARRRHKKYGTIMMLVLLCVWST